MIVIKRYGQQKQIHIVKSRQQKINLLNQLSHLHLTYLMLNIIQDTKIGYTFLLKKKTGGGSSDGVNKNHTNPAKQIHYYIVSTKSIVVTLS